MTGDCENSCPRPVNPQVQLLKKGSDGELWVCYTWESSTGNLDDLKDCEITEFVIFPEVGEFLWPRPWNQTTDSPHEPPGVPANTCFWGCASGNLGCLRDMHHVGELLHPIPTDSQPATFSAIQYIIYKSKCHRNRAPGTLLGPFQITRAINQKTDGNGQIYWEYKIVKTGQQTVLEHSVRIGP